MLDHCPGCLGTARELGVAAPRAPAWPAGLGTSLLRGRGCRLVGVALQGLAGAEALHPSEMHPCREIRNVELLKLRFGEAPMHFCEVMLKVGTRAPHSHLVPPPPRPSGGLSPQDMADSRRINANIREEDEKRPAEEQPPFGVYAVILSSEFWPPFKDEKLEVPEDIREALEVYCRKYEKLKVGPRCWESSSVLRDPCPPLSLPGPVCACARTSSCVHLPVCVCAPSALCCA